MRKVIQITTAEDFAYVMRDARVRRGITQADLAVRIGKSRKWVIDVERGETMPTLPAVIQVSHVLGFSLSLNRVDEESQDLLSMVLGE